ncbi:MAG: NUDIX hydrolase [Acidimicrobiales bacterium]
MGRPVIHQLSPRSRAAVVRAAGGVLVRQARRRQEVAVIHRPGREDWSLPKGKLEQGESFEEGALREVLEETGYACVLGGYLGCTEYRDRKDRPKVVAYWLMDAAPGASFFDEPEIAVDEVDELRWMELGVARRALSYRHDRELLGLVGPGRLAQLG